MWWLRRQNDSVGLYIGWISDAWFFFALHFCSGSHAFAYFELLLYFYDGKGEEAERVVRVCVCVWVWLNLEILLVPPDKVLQFSRTHFHDEILKTYCLVRYLKNQLNSLGWLPFIESEWGGRHIMSRVCVAIPQTSNQFLTLKLFIFFIFAVLICRAHRTQQTKWTWTTDILRWQGRVVRFYLFVFN